MLLTYSAYLIDLDGVVYRGESILPGAKDFISWLDQHQKKYLFLTNNSFASETEVISRLARMGIATDEEHVLSAAQAAVQNIARRFPASRVYVVGESPLIALTRSYHLQVVDLAAHEAEVVLVGLDRTFDYEKLTSAVASVRKGAAFVAINRDPLLPVPGDLIPGCGAMVAAIEAASGIHPEVIGKPEPTLFYEAMRMLGSQPQETVMIGDGMDSDIAGGKAAHIPTILVLSGRTTRAQLEQLSIQPDFVYDDLAAVLRDQPNAP